LWLGGKDKRDRSFPNASWEERRRGSVTGWTLAGDVVDLEAGATNTFLKGGENLRTSSDLARIGFVAPSAKTKLIKAGRIRQKKRKE